MEKLNTSTSAKRNTADRSMLQNFFLEELRDVCSAEKLLVKFLPRLEKAATSEELKDAFTEHLEITEKQVVRLEQIFQLLKENLRTKKCEGMEGLIKESQTVVDHTEEGSATRDVALIIASQKIEHYEIAAYGGLVKLAKTMGKNDIAKILAETLNEEKQADELLTNLAEKAVNQEALQELEQL